MPHANQQQRLKQIRARLKQKMQVLNLSVSSLGEDKNTKESISNNIKQIESLINEINKQLNSFETKKKLSENIKTKIESLDECPTCLQKVADFHKKLVKENQDKIIYEYDENITKLIKKRDENVKELERIKKVFEEALEKWGS